jgi:hypothetical protein
MYRRLLDRRVDPGVKVALLFVYLEERRVVVDVLAGHNHHHGRPSRPSRRRHLGVSATTGCGSEPRVRGRLRRQMVVMVRDKHDR